VGLSSGTKSGDTLLIWKQKLQNASTPEEILRTAACYHAIYGQEYEAAKKEVWGLLDGETQARIRRLMGSTRPAQPAQPTEGSS
jgi:hypothetical protein